MESKGQSNNLRNMFNASNTPTDIDMRNIIDVVDTEVAFRPIKEFLLMLQRDKHLENTKYFYL